MEKKQLFIDEFIKKEDGYFFEAKGQFRKDLQTDLKAFWGEDVASKWGIGEAEDGEFVISYREGYSGSFETGTFTFETSKEILDLLIDHSVYKTITAKKSEAELSKSSILLSLEELLNEMNIKYENEWFNMD